MCDGFGRTGDLVVAEGCVGWWVLFDLVKTTVRVGRVCKERLGLRPETLRTSGRVDVATVVLREAVVVRRTDRAEDGKRMERGLHYRCRTGHSSTTCWMKGGKGSGAL